MALAACLAVCGLTACAGNSGSASSASGNDSSSSAAASESSESTASADESSDSASTSATSASSSATSAASAMQDILVERTVYRTDEKEDNYSEYVVVYYGADTHTLKGFVDETHFMKVAGYTQEDLEGADYESVFPNLSSLDFAKTSVVDEGDYYCVMVTFKDLDDVDNVRAFIDSGIFTPDSGNDDAILIDANSVMNHLVSQGATEIDAIEAADIPLHASID